MDFLVLEFFKQIFLGVKNCINFIYINLKQHSIDKKNNFNFGLMNFWQYTKLANFAPLYH